MNNYNIIKKNNLKVDKYTMIGNVTIIDTPLGKFVLKENKSNRIYEYLLSRGFNYFPEIVDYDDDTILFRYIDNINYNDNEKALDFIKILSLLHIKTSYFINITENEYKKIYEDINIKINDINEYYNKLANSIESKIYMSPGEYLLIRNISIIFSAISYCKLKLDNYKELTKDKNKKRVVTLYNNIDLKHLLKDINNTYLISFDKSYVDSPIYDLVSFYNKYQLDFNFIEIMKVYETKFKLLEDEKVLFLLLISIPDKIVIDNSINGIKKMKNSIDKIYNKLEILNFEEEKSGSTKKKEDYKK